MIDWDELNEGVVAESPSFADYAAATTREIPVVAFERR